MLRFFSALCICIAPLARGTEPYSEEAVKAAYLYRFSAYVEWPGDAASSQSRSVSIAVLGRSDVAKELERLMPRLAGAHRAVRIRSIESIEELGDAQILFIAGDGMARLRRAIAAVKNKPVLTVTEADQGLQAGSVINFVNENRRVRFEVSLPAAQRAYSLQHAQHRPQRRIETPT